MTNANPLRAKLDYKPQPLRFGTSGRRGKVVDLTQLEIYLNALAELEYLQTLPLTEGGIRKADEFYFAYDLRPSSISYDPAYQGHGEIAQAIVRAIQDASLRPVNLGAIPTPALAYYALRQSRGSIMITGSHIPFDRNGYKTCSAKGELLKRDEGPINDRVEQVRRRLYDQPYSVSAFDRQGRFKTGHQDLPPECSVGREAYLRRYLDFFGDQTLRGKRLLVYEHSAVGRDLLVEVLEKLGAEVFPAGRSDTFVPIDTENIDEAQLGKIQALTNEVWQQAGPIDAIVSTDGDSDRPLVLGVEPAARPSGTEAACRVRFFGGDLLGMIVAEYLGADAVVVPISCNDAVDRGALKDRVEPKTCIGSPYVIAGMEKARLKGCQAICGWEANGGFLTGSDIRRHGTLTALPTRDAFLPILSVLFRSMDQSLPLGELFETLPKRFSRAALLRDFPRSLSRQVVARYSPADPMIKDAFFGPDGIRLLDEEGAQVPKAGSEAGQMETIRIELQRIFGSAYGFTPIVRLNYTDGARLFFSNGDVAHFRPSGNADELRIYAVADTQARADAIATLGVAEPDGILRQLAHRAREAREG